MLLCTLHILFVSALTTMRPLCVAVSLLLLLSPVPQEALIIGSGPFWSTSRWMARFDTPTAVSIPEALPVTASVDDGSYFSSSRRTFWRSGALKAVAFCTTTTVIMTAKVQPASARMPMVSTEEFTTITRDSSRSIERVEFSGPKSENVVVRLVDGTAFGIRDVVESSTDPRSPLKIAALCNANQIPYKFVDLEAVLAATPRKKKVYANSRVLEAAERQKEKVVRMQQDEELRQEELAEMRGF